MTKGTSTPTLLASMNSRRLLRKLYGQELNIQTPLIHSYIPLKKSVFEKIWSVFKEEIETFYQIDLGVKTILISLLFLYLMPCI